MVTFKQGITEITTDLENLYPDYVSSKGDYTTGNKVTYKGMYYEVIPSSVPINYYPDLNPLYFKKIGVANKGSIIDLRSKTYSTKSGGFYVMFMVEYGFDSLAIGYWSAYKLKIEALNNDLVPVHTYLYETQSINTGTKNIFDYIYKPAVRYYDKSRYIPVEQIGKYIKVTFESGSGFASPYCGFLIYGKAIDMGKAKSSINFKFNSYSLISTDEFGVMSVDERNKQNLIDFETVIDRDDFSDKRAEISQNFDKFMVFVLDETKSDLRNDFTGIAKIQDCSQLYDEFDKSTIGWSLVESI